MLTGCEQRRGSQTSGFSWPVFGREQDLGFPCAEHSINQNKCCGCCLKTNKDEQFPGFPTDKKCRAQKSVLDRPRLLLKRSRNTLPFPPSEVLLARRDMQPYTQMWARTRTGSTHKLWFQWNLGWVVSVHCCCTPVFWDGMFIGIAC